MIIVGLEDVPESGDPLLHQDLVVVVAQLLQQGVHLVGGESVALQRVGEQQHQVLDLQHKAGVGAVRRVSLKKEPTVQNQEHKTNRGAEVLVELPHDRKVMGSILPARLPAHFVH